MEKELSKSISICYGHEEYVTPLVHTYAFNGAEYWCPYCGQIYGMMSTERIDNTKQLQKRKDQYTKYTNRGDEAFLHAKGILVCISTMWKGKRVKPEELPKTENKRLEKIRKAWSYNRKIEDILKKK